MCVLNQERSAFTNILRNEFVVLKRTFVFLVGKAFESSLTSESVEGTALSLEGIDDIHGGDGLPLGVFGVGDGITDDVFQENLEDTSGFFVDQAGDTLDTTTAS